MAGSAFAISSAGTPHGYFPDGDWTFPVDGATMRALEAAVRDAMRGSLLVLPEHLERDPLPRHPLPIQPLLAFIRPRLAAQLSTGDRVELVARNTVALASARAEALRSFGAPAILIEHELAWARRAAAPGWRPDLALDLDAMVPDAVAAAFAVDLDANANADTNAGAPLANADVSDLVLLAALCAVGPTTRSVSPPDDGAARWRPLADPAEQPAAHDRSQVLVRPAIASDRVDRLDIASVETASRNSASGDGGGLLAVSLVADLDGN